MSVVLQPYLKPVLMSHVTEASHILRGYFVGEIAAQLAQKLVGKLG